MEDKNIGKRGEKRERERKEEKEKNKGGVNQDLQYQYQYTIVHSAKNKKLSKHNTKQKVVLD